MATVREVLLQKGTGVYTIGESASVLDATRLMNEHKIGALVVTRGDQPVGMFTERDVLRRIVAAERDPKSTTVGEVMTNQFVVCSPQHDLNEARAIMRSRRVRHLPVLGSDGKLRGMLSIGDLNAWCIQESEVTIRYMEEYIHGRV